MPLRGTGDEGQGTRGWMATGAVVVAVVAVGLSSCVARRGEAGFRVVKAEPEYLLRAPDQKEAPFRDVPGTYTNVGQGWVALKPGMELRIENAYYREGAPKHGLSGFVGTEVARYRVRVDGELRATEFESHVAQRPADQPGVQELLGAAQRRMSAHRYFYQVLLDRRTQAQGAILLSGESEAELARLTDQVAAAPESVCGAGSRHCTVFPQACTVALEMPVRVNGVLRMVVWGSVLLSVAPRGKAPELWRRYRGRMVPVELDAGDANALRVPLLPGDRIRWR